LTKTGLSARSGVGTFRVGLISDTHGLLRPGAARLLQGCDHIVHAGDIGNAEVLAALSRIAPVTAVRGNNDQGTWAAALPATASLKAGEIAIHVLHDLAELDLDPAIAGYRAVVSGHSHKPRVHEKDGVLYVNPGSAGPRRFSLPISVAFLTVSGSTVTAELQELQLPKAASPRGA
jgi:putative phosphoesterase